jgi:ATP-dependent exoDNAse (exonuclease V) beta subunit
MDFEARQKAICPQESFIVQAPAGSGKTELLTQRLLALLPTVDEPEQIIALTFTRKAALEMAHRVLHALEDAKNQTPLKSEHQKATRALALRALEHAKHRQWGLLEHPQRLKIKTFDSFCMEIYKAIPKDEFATLSELQTDPTPIYRQAVQNWFNLCRAEEQFHAPLACLIQQANNQLATLFKQFISLLAQRDQWLPIIGQNQHKSYEAHIQSLQKIAHHHWDQWHQLLPKTQQDDFIALLGEYHDYAPEGFPELKDLGDLASLKGTELTAFVKLLLTGNGEVRKAFDQHVGVFQKKPADPRYKTLKENSANFLTSLKTYPEFIEKIKQLVKVPHPDEIEIDLLSIAATIGSLPAS